MSDQAIVLTDVEEKMFELDNRVVARAIKTKDPAAIANHIRQLRRQGQVSGLSLAHTLYLWKDAVDKFGYDPDDFEDMVLSETGLSVQTTRKYVQMWQAIFNNPQVEAHVVAALRGQPIQNLLLIAPAAKEDGLDEEHWERLADAESKSEVRQIIREVRGVRTSGNNALIIRLKRDGILEARRGDGVYESIGYLSLNLRGSSEVIDAAISRILRASGIVDV